MADEDFTVAARIAKPLYDKILKRQRELKKLTGIEPSISAVVRVMIEEAPNGATTRRRVRTAA